MSTIDRIRPIAEAVVVSQGAYLVDVVIRGEQKRTYLEIYCDTDAGMTTELCSEISREISRALDGQDIFRDRYYLVVSSPGVDRPLKFPRQYPRNIGRTLTIRYRGEEGTETVKGVLTEATAERLGLLCEPDETRVIPWDRVLEGRVHSAW